MVCYNTEAGSLLEYASPAWHHEERFVPGIMTRAPINDSQYGNSVCRRYELVLAAEGQSKLATVQDLAAFKQVAQNKTL